MYKFEQTVQHSGWEGMTLEFPHSEWPLYSRMFSRPAWAAMRRCAELKPSPANGMQRAVMQPASLFRFNAQRSPARTLTRTAGTIFLTHTHMCLFIVSSSLQPCVQRSPARTLTWTAGASFSTHSHERLWLAGWLPLYPSESNNTLPFLRAALTRTHFDVDGWNGVYFAFTANCWIQNVRALAPSPNMEWEWAAWGAVLCACLA